MQEIVLYSKCMGNDKKMLGHLGEQVAADFLVKRGWQLIEVNARNRWGEIDLIMHDCDKQLVFVEVKTVETSLDNRQFSYDPVDKLSSGKIHKLHKTIIHYMTNRQETWRLDAVVVYLDQEASRAHCRYFAHITNQW